MWSGRIAGLPDGEGGPDGRPRKGGVPVRRIRVEGEDGETLEIEHGPAADAAARRVRGIREIGAFAFDRCPICLAPVRRVVSTSRPPRSAARSAPSSANDATTSSAAGSRSTCSTGGTAQFATPAPALGAFLEAPPGAGSVSQHAGRQVRTHPPRPGRRSVPRHSRQRRVRLHLHATQPSQVPARRAQARLSRGVPRPAGDTRHARGPSHPTRPRRSPRCACWRGLSCQ